MPHYRNTNANKMCVKQEHWVVVLFHNSEFLANIFYFREGYDIVPYNNKLNILNKSSKKAALLHRIFVMIKP